MPGGGCVISEARSQGVPLAHDVGRSAVGLTSSDARQCNAAQTSSHPGAVSCNFSVQRSGELPVIQQELARCGAGNGAYSAVQIGEEAPPCAVRTDSGLQHTPPNGDLNALQNGFLNAEVRGLYLFA